MDNYQENIECILVCTSNLVPVAKLEKPLCDTIVKFGVVGSMLNIGINKFC